MLNAVFQALFLIGLVTGSVIRGVYIKQNITVGTVDNRENLLDRFLLFFAFIGMMVLPFIYLFSPWLDFANCQFSKRVCFGTGLTGAIILGAAVWLLWKSHADLGKNWSPHIEIRKEHALVTSGSFRYIRHPMYAAHWLWGIAQALLLQNWIAGPAMLLVFFPLYITRVPREERMMLEYFGEKYFLYMQRTRRILPSLQK